MLSHDYGLPHSLIGVRPSQAASSFIATSIEYYQRNSCSTSEVTHGKPQFFSQICWLDYPLIDFPMTVLFHLHILHPNRLKSKGLSFPIKSSIFIISTNPQWSMIWKWTWDGVNSGWWEYLDLGTSGHSSVQYNPGDYSVKLVITPSTWCTHKTQVLKTTTVKCLSKILHLSLPSYCSTHIFFGFDNLVKITHTQPR